MSNDPKHLPEELMMLRWWGPDPALRFILEVGDPGQKQQAVSAGIKMHTETLQAQMNYLSTLNGIVTRTR